MAWMELLFAALAVAIPFPTTVLKFEKCPDGSRKCILKGTPTTQNLNVLVTRTAEPEAPVPKAGIDLSGEKWDSVNSVIVSNVETQKLDAMIDHPKRPTMKKTTRKTTKSFGTQTARALVVPGVVPGDAIPTMVTEETNIAPMRPTIAKTTGKAVKPFIAHNMPGPVVVSYSLEPPIARTVAPKKPSSTAMPMEGPDPFVIHSMPGPVIVAHPLPPLVTKTTTTTEGQSLKSTRTTGMNKFPRGNILSIPTVVPPATEPEMRSIWVPYPAEPARPYRAPDHADGYIIPVETLILIYWDEVRRGVSHRKRSEKCIQNTQGMPASATLNVQLAPTRIQKEAERKSESKKQDQATKPPIMTDRMVEIDKEAERKGEAEKLKQATGLEKRRVGFGDKLGCHLAMTDDKWPYRHPNMSKLGWGQAIHCPD